MYMHVCMIVWLLVVKEREREKEAREEEMALLQRMKEAELFKEWEAQEDTVRKDSIPPFPFSIPILYSHS